MLDRYIRIVNRYRSKLFWRIFKYYKFLKNIPTDFLQVCLSDNIEKALSEIIIAITLDSY